MIGGFVIGSVTSRHVTKARIMALHPKFSDQIHLAEILHFAKLDIKTVNSTTSVWTACVQFYDEHNCKKWFGGPTEVWARSKSADIYHISLSSIKSKVAFCEKTVDFGRFMGKQTVFVVSIINS